MSDYYSTQYSNTAFNATTLTTTFAGNQREIETAGMSKIAFGVSYTMGAAETANKIEIQLEQSPDGTNWFPLSIDSTSSTSVLTNRVWEFTGTGSFDFIVSIGYRKMRMSLRESGVSTNAGTATVVYTVSGQ